MKETLFYLLPHDMRRAVFSVLKKKKFISAQQQRISNADYSYQPFDELSCIFVHIPKTGGISICRSLFGNLAGGHDSIKNYQILFSKKDFLNYFKFGFVRNPWDRLFSAYNFLKHGGFNDSDREWANTHLSKFREFNHFVETWVNKKNIYRYRHFIPQSEFLCSPITQRILVDFVGFFENLESDFSYVKEKLGLTEAVLVYENITQKNYKKDYRTAYTDRTRNIVADIYRRDIEIFGYDFCGSLLKNQLSRRVVPSFRLKRLYI